MRTWVVCMLVACGGGGAQGGDDVAPDGPGPGGCDDACAADACGAVYREGCAPLDCGQCRYAGTVLDMRGESAAIEGDEIAYLHTHPMPEVYVARRNGNAWTSELVATPQAGNDLTVDLAIATDGTEWVVYASGNGDVEVVSRSGGTWSAPQLAGQLGYRPRIALLGDGTPIVAFAANAGLTVARGPTWMPTIATTDIAMQHALATHGQAIHVAWRTREQDARYASSTGGAFADEDVQTGIGTTATDATVALAVDADGAPHVLYSVAENHVTHATKGAAWTLEPFGIGYGQHGGAGLAIDGAHVYAGYLHAFGVNVAERMPGGFADQTLTGTCYEGFIDVGFAKSGALEVVWGGPSCGVHWMERTGARFPGDWFARCTAAAATAATTACGCAADPTHDDCCVAYAAGYTNSDCSAGKSVEAIADALICGEATADPAAIDACTADLAGAACLLDHARSTIDLPGSCHPL